MYIVSQGQMVYLWKPVEYCHVHACTCSCKSESCVLLYQLLCLLVKSRPVYVYMYVWVDQRETGKVMCGAGNIAY